MRVGRVRDRETVTRQPLRKITWKFGLDCVDPTNGEDLAGYTQLGSIWTIPDY